MQTRSAAPSPATPSPLDAAALRAWVGSRLVVGFEGSEPDSPGVLGARAQAEAGHIGGLIFFRYNIASPAQLRRLTAFIKTWQIPEANRPLLLVVDQEGGRVQRLGREQGFTPWPSALDVGALPAHEADDVFEGMVAELADYGFNLNAAPVVDLHRDGSAAIGRLRRSFGDSPQQVIAYAQRSIEAHRHHGVSPAIKHFPGHGFVSGDTHRGITDASGSWDPRELLPFSEIIRSSAVPVVMTSHLINRELDPSGEPATFSRAMITDLLRGQLQFDGVAITDDLGMGAIKQQYGLKDTVRRALESGHDLLCFGLNRAAEGRGESPAHRGIPDLLEICVAGVAEGVVAHGITAAAMAQSDRRLNTLRSWLRQRGPEGS